MVEGWDDDGRLVRLAPAWVASVIRTDDGKIRIELMGGGSLIAKGSLKVIMAALRAGRETMH